MTDEPLGTHVLELQLADVIDETADARSLVFEVPEGSQIPADRLRHAPGQFLTLRVPSDRTGSVARCYSLSSSPFTDDALTVTVKRTAGGYASNWLCDNAHAGHARPRARSVGHVRPEGPRRRLPAAGRGQRDHPDDGDLEVGAVRGRRQGHAGVRQPRREIGDLRRRPARTRRQVPRPLHGRALDRDGAGAAERGGAGRLGGALRRTRGVHLRARTVHGRRRAGAGDRGRRTGTDPPRGVQVPGVRPVCCRRHRRRTRATKARRRRSSPSTGKPRRCAGRATRNCSTCCSTRASTRRSPAARGTAVPAQCWSRAATSTWRSTTSSRRPTSTRA